jgi:Cu-Zn family superoxide dismutase
MRFARRSVLLAAGVLPMLVAAAGPAAGAPAAAQTAVVGIGQFAPWNSAWPPQAVTYDPSLVPVGAVIVVTSVTLHGKTLVWLSAARLAPNRRYGTHVHRRACGADPATAGGHYENVPDPVQPSVRPEYANPQNEVWLDFSTGAGGSGTAVALVDWTFRSGEANSVVLHAEGTRTGPGEAGTAGRRLGCLTVAF